MILGAIGAIAGLIFGGSQKAPPPDDEDPFTTFFNIARGDTINPGGLKIRNKTGPLQKKAAMKTRVGSPASVVQSASPKQTGSFAGNDDVCFGGS